jgi:hypothetical protein
MQIEMAFESLIKKDQDMKQKEQIQEENDATNIVSNIVSRIINQQAIVMIIKNSKRFHVEYWHTFNSMGKYRLSEYVYDLIEKKLELKGLKLISCIPDIKCTHLGPRHVASYPSIKISFELEMISKNSSLPVYSELG